MKHSTIAIIGAGSVGTTTAYATILKGLPADIILIDLDEKRCSGEIHDLEDAIAFTENNATITAGNLGQAGSADIIIISAGARQMPGQSRRELLAKNSAVINSIIDGMKPIKSNAIIIMVTNPLDVLVAQAQKLSQLPHNQVFGSGTFLDTQRMRLALAQRLAVAPSSIDAYMIGEHGDCQFAAWSSAIIGAMPLLEFSHLSADICKEIEQETRNKAYAIIDCKGSTFFGVATAVATLCSMIIFDQKKIVPLSVYQKEFDCYFSSPVILGSSGIEQHTVLHLNDEEKKALKKSVDQIKLLEATIR